MAREEERLKLGKGVAFAKARLKRLRQEDGTWEADFQALPKPITQSQTHYLGMVVAPDGSLLAHSQVEGRPTVNDMATLLAHAMRRPLTGKAHRPRRLHVRGHPQWKELFPHLDEIGELPKVQRAYQGYLRQQRNAHRVGMVKPTTEQQSVERLFPAIAQWVRLARIVDVSSSVAGEYHENEVRKDFDGLRMIGAIRHRHQNPSVFFLSDPVAYFSVNLHLSDRRLQAVAGKYAVWWLPAHFPSGAVALAV